MNNRFPKSKQNIANKKKKEQRKITQIPQYHIKHNMQNSFCQIHTRNKTKNYEISRQITKKTRNILLLRLYENNKC